MNNLFLFLLFLAFVTVFGSCTGDLTGLSSEAPSDCMPCGGCPYFTGTSTPTATRGDIVTLHTVNASHFPIDGDSRVTLGGIPLTVLEVTDTTIVVEIPSDARSGTLAVCAPNPILLGGPGTVRAILCSDDPCIRGFRPDVELRIQCPDPQEQVFGSVQLPELATRHTTQLLNGNIVVCTPDHLATSGMMLTFFNGETGGQVAERTVDISRRFYHISAVNATETGGFVVVAVLVDNDALMLLSFDAGGELLANQVVPGSESMLLTDITSTFDGFLAVGKVTEAENVYGVALKFNKSCFVLNDWTSANRIGVLLDGTGVNSAEENITAARVVEASDGSFLVFANGTSRFGGISTTYLFTFNPFGQLLGAPVIISQDEQVVDLLKTGDEYLLLVRNMASDGNGDTESYSTCVVNKSGAVTGNKVLLSTDYEDSDFYRLIKRDRDAKYVVAGVTSSGISLMAKGVLLTLLDDNRMPIAGRERSFNGFDSEGASVMVSALYGTTTGELLVLGGLHPLDTAAKVYTAWVNCL